MLVWLENTRAEIRQALLSQFSLLVEFFFEKVTVGLSVILLNALNCYYYLMNNSPVFKWSGQSSNFKYLNTGIVKVLYSDHSNTVGSEYWTSPVLK